MTDRQLARHIEDIDKGRREYYRYFTGQKWEDISHYDLCINTGLITLETAVGLIRDYVNCAWGGLLEQAKREAKP